MKVIFTLMVTLCIALATANCASAKGPKGGKKGGPWQGGNAGGAQPLHAGAAGQMHGHGNRSFVPMNPTSPSGPGTLEPSEGQTYRLLRHGNRYQWVPADQYPDFVPPGHTF